MWGAERVRRLQVPCVEVWLGCSLVILAIQLLPDAIVLLRERPRPGHQTPARASLLLPSGSRVEVRYFVYLPRDYSAGQHWPLLLYLHGSGERGNDLRQVLRSGLPSVLDRGNHLPFVVVSPQCSAGTSSWNSQQLLALIDHIEARFAIDVERIHVAGFSMGGFGTWMLCCAAPGRFAAAVPVAGGGDPAQARSLLNLRIWAFHGSDDDVVPVARTTRMIRAIEALGGTPRLTVFEGAGHGIDRSVFARDDLYSWLLEQRRTKTPTAPSVWSTAAHRGARHAPPP